MGFTTSCFIRENTLELRKRLEALGYKPLLSIEDGECLSTASNLENYHSIPAALFDDKDSYRTYDCAGRIDCGTNEDLFLALAALRDDTDNGQFFVFEERFVSRINPDVIIEKGTLLKCCMDKWRMPYFPFHKATVKELIEHFKEKGG
ncbi:hypothetical protein K0G47_20680 [Bacteroides thetaiotaomicron]|uniref:hypothetical protein n=1 Tax=Bacteroides thetaiotaomicron TaxID=818 RepID=UPI001F4172D6|nr:hypothetical protein [Bacteroides thetaiotaomicron]MCE9020959.1 hypothetical protein [Bacteroides thetaiotaomicron]